MDFISHYSNLIYKMQCLLMLKPNLLKHSIELPVSVIIVEFAEKLYRLTVTSFNLGAGMAIN